MFYSLRITTEDNLKTELETFCKTIKADKYLFSIESGTETQKQHYQGAIKSETKLQTIRSNFKKQFPKFVGNEKYSLKSRYTPIFSKKSIPCDENIFAYCAKENSTPKSEFVMNITKDEYVGYNQAYWKKNQDFKILKNNKAKAAKEKKDTLLSSAVNYLCNGNQTLDKKPILPSITDEQIVERLISFYSENDEVLFNQHTFKWLYTKILQLYYKELYKEFMKKQMSFLLI
jgi:hypothetical protein